MTRILSVAAALIMMTSAASEAMMLYDGQERSVAAFGFAQDFTYPELDSHYNKSVSAAPGDFGLFDEGVDGSADAGFAWCNSSASQTSSLDPSHITAVGEVLAYAMADPMYGDSYATADSDVTAAFHVASPTAILLSGSLYESGNWSGSASLTLREDGSVIFSQSTDGLDFVAIEYPRTLLSGRTYELSLSASAVRFGGNGYDITLEVVPEPTACLLVALGTGVLTTRPLRRRSRASSD